MQVRIWSDIKTSVSDAVKAKNELAKAGTSNLWAKMPAAAGLIFIWIIERTGSVAENGNFAIRSDFGGFGRPYGNRET